MARSSPWGPGISDLDPGATSGEPAAQSAQGLSPQFGPSAARGVVLPALYHPAPAREGQTVSVSFDPDDPFSRRSRNAIRRVGRTMRIRSRPSTSQCSRRSLPFSTMRDARRQDRIATSRGAHEPSGDGSVASTKAQVGPASGIGGWRAPAGTTPRCPHRGRAAEPEWSSRTKLERAHLVLPRRGAPRRAVRMGQGPVTAPLRDVSNSFSAAAALDTDVAIACESA